MRCPLVLVPFPSLLVVALAACSDAPAPPEASNAAAATESTPTPTLPPTPTPTLTPAPPTAGDSAEPRPWLDFRGTSILGFGVLRLVPPPGGGRFRIEYEDTPDDGYSITDNAQLFVLPGNAFAAGERAWAGDFLGFTRTPPYDSGYVPDALRLDVEIRVADETTVLVAYGPWTGPDTGRPPGDAPTFSLAVTALDTGGAHAWLESEAGEMITTNWTPRPEVSRGTPTADPITHEPVWIEVQPLILYDASLARSSDEPPAFDLGSSPHPEHLLERAASYEASGHPALAADARDRAADLAALAARRDSRIVLTPELTARFRRVPIRWR